MGFTLVELLVVLSVIVILSALAMRSYEAYGVKQRDSQRVADLRRFAGLLEQYRNQFGYYPCGSGDATHCAYDIPGTVDQLYDYACTDSLPLAFGNLSGNDPQEVHAFLNGGQCCVENGKDGYPTPTTTYSAPEVNNRLCPNVSESSSCDDTAWGLYRWKYLETLNVNDPINAVMNDKAYYYCYAVTGKGRKEYALFARMENDAKNKEDGGECNHWYELYSPGYNRADGWVPWVMEGLWDTTATCRS